MHAVMVTTNNTDIYKPMHDISKEYANGSFSLFFFNDSILMQLFCYANLKSSLLQCGIIL